MQTPLPILTPSSGSIYITQGQLLKHNYPEPFTHATVIGFHLPYKCKVKLAIFDIKGRMISSLLERQMNAGEYTTEWDRGNTPGGCEAGNYTYRLLIVNETGILMDEISINAI